MELMIYLVLALAAFGGVVALVVGLVSAPTPVLVTILIIGLILTQKSINKFTQPKINLFEDEDKNNRERIEVALANSETEANPEQVNPLKSMTYRGFNYNRHPHLDKSSIHTSKTKIKYRGLTVSLNNKIVS